VQGDTSKSVRLRKSVRSTAKWLGALLCALLVYATQAAAESAHVGYPNSIVVLGHSGATGRNSDPQLPNRDVRENSWATGTNPAVNSVYLRILAANPAIKGHNFNLARDGARVLDLVDEAQFAVTIKPKPELVLIQIMDNDIVCPAIAQDYAAFRATFVRALGVLAKGVPNARIFVVSQYGSPATYVEVIKDIPEARAPLTGTGPCDLFDASGGINDEHVAVLDNVVHGYEEQLAAGCARFVHCRYDGGAFGRAVDAFEDLSSDWNHASIRGHAKAAAVAWSAIFDFTDQIAPASTASARRSSKGRRVTLGASDAAGVSGIEYKLVAPKKSVTRFSFRRYKTPVLVGKGWTLVWRAVDVNGNSEATHSLRG